ncbi:MAG: hypothetical protein LPD71_12115, partial [Shewanella sp.]|nr:hypothetical protein [Shewanella sp.]
IYVEHTTVALLCIKQRQSAAKTIFKGQQTLTSPLKPVANIISIGKKGGHQAAKNTSNTITGREPDGELSGCPVPLSIKTAAISKANL